MIWVILGGIIGVLIGIGKASQQAQARGEEFHLGTYLLWLMLILGVFVAIFAPPVGIIMVLIALFSLVGISYNKHDNAKSLEESTKSLHQKILDLYENDIVKLMYLDIKPEDFDKLDTDFGIGIVDNREARVNKSFKGTFALLLDYQGTIIVAGSYDEYELTNVQYQGQYVHQTISDTSGRSGSAAVGGLLLGTTGAVIGASGQRTTYSNTKDKEVQSWSLLEMRNITKNKNFVVEVLLDRDKYNSLVKDYLKH